MNYKQEYRQLLEYDISIRESAEKDHEFLLQNF
jgi:hypothetical protein